METWLHGTNSRLNGNLPFLAHTKEFHTTVTGPLIRRYAITISKHRVVNVNSQKEDAWIIKKPRSGNYHIMGRVLEEQAWDKFDRLEKRFIKIHPTIKAVSFTLYIYTFRHRHVILQNCLVSALLLNIYHSWIFSEEIRNRTSFHGNNVGITSLIRLAARLIAKLFYRPSESLIWIGN